MSMGRRIATILAVSAMAMAGGIVAASAAGAAPPTIERNRLSFNLTDLACSDLGLSYDIDLDGQEVIQDFGDRVRIHTTWLGTVVATDGTSLLIHHSWSDDLDFVRGTWTITGLAFGARVEGTSLARMDRGRLVLDLGSFEPIFMAGRWTPGPFDPHEATCELIAAAQG